MQTNEDDRIFAIGDCAFYIPPDEVRPIPPRAEAAHQVANTVARNIALAISGRPLVSFKYKDYRSLVSLSGFSTVGSLMGALVCGSLWIQGRVAHFVYLSLYRLHLISIHCWLRGGAMLLVLRVNKIVRPKLKLH